MQRRLVKVLLRHCRDVFSNFEKAVRCSFPNVFLFVYIHFIINVSSATFDCIKLAPIDSTNTVIRVGQHNSGYNILRIKKGPRFVFGILK